MYCLKIVKAHTLLDRNNYTSNYALPAGDKMMEQIIVSYYTHLVYRLNIMVIRRGMSRFLLH